MLKMTFKVIFNSFVGIVCLAAYYLLFNDVSRWTEMHLTNPNYYFRPTSDNLKMIALMALFFLVSMAIFVFIGMFLTLISKKPWIDFLTASAIPFILVFIMSGIDPICYVLKSYEYFFTSYHVLSGLYNSEIGDVLNIALVIVPLVFIWIGMQIKRRYLRKKQELKDD